MEIGEKVVTYTSGLIALALIVRYGPQVSSILGTSFSGVSRFSMAVIGGGSASPVG